MKKVLFGIDVLLSEKNKFKSLRIGLVTNNAATTSWGESSRVALLKAGFTITKLFSPEHGLAAKGEDGAYQSSGIDSLTQLPIVSLYGDYLKPSEKDFSDIDILLFDIPDVGCQFYTYLLTMTYVMEACALYHKSLIILDRPNPVGGNIDKAEGPMLDEVNCSSFIGRWNVPVRHSCTLGELANYFSATRIKNLQLEIINVQNWNRNHTADEAGWKFTPTSPAIRNVETALLYPGMGMLEGINVNEGRGTDNDFKIMGAPWIDARQINKAFTDLQLPGIKATPVSYTPAWGMYANEECNGLQFSISDVNKFQPVQTGLQLLHLLISLYPVHCRERLYPTVANPTGAGHLNKLTGVHYSFDRIKQGELISTELLTKDWKEIIESYLIY